MKHSPSGMTEFHGLHRLPADHAILLWDPQTFEDYLWLPQGCWRKTQVCTKYYRTDPVSLWHLSKTPSVFLDALQVGNFHSCCLKLPKLIQLTVGMRMTVIFLYFIICWGCEKASSSRETWVILLTFEIVTPPSMSCCRSTAADTPLYTASPWNCMELVTLSSTALPSNLLSCLNLIPQSDCQYYSTALPR